MNKLQQVAKALQDIGVQKELCNAAAKVAIEAMKEPTEGMVRAAYSEKDAINAGFTKAYRTMINTALKE